MLRREFLGALGVGAAIGAEATMCAAERGIPDARALKIQTVRGPILATELGRTLPHEHVLVDFIGADAVSPSRYNADQVFTSVLPHLKRIRELGVQSLF